MKIAILTLSASDNCGSLLQAYALQNTLEKIELDVDILNFSTKISEKMYRVFHPSYIKDPRKLLGLITNRKALCRQRSDYQDFRNRYLKLTSQKYKNSLELRSADGQYDTIICGSDQVWNTSMHDFDDAYLMEWCNKSSKVAYAVSLGDKKNDDLHILKKKLQNLNSFKQISVRETSSKKRFKENLNCEVELCLDPTLLLSMNEWMALTNEVEAPKERFIFYYSYNYGDEIKNNMVMQFARIMDLPVYVINASRWVDGKHKKYGFKVYEHSGPTAFLNLMQFSERSIVESFHGVLFSYIFKKDFWFLKNSESLELDDRINDILEILNMKSRVLRPSLLNNIKELNATIDYSSATEEYGKLKTASLDYIKRITER